MSKAEILATLNEAQRDLDACVVVLDAVAGNIEIARAQARLLPDDHPPPEILHATITPNALPTGGGMVTISAALANTTALLLDGDEIDLNVRPMPWQVECRAAHAFTLTARGPGGEASVSLPVTVARIAAY